MQRSLNPAMLVAAALATLLPLAAAAAPVTLTQPDNFSNGSEVPALSSSAEASLGRGAWQADGSLTGNDGQQHLIYLQGDQPGPLEGGQTSYPAAGANPRLLFPGSETVTLGDVLGLSWDTKTSGSVNWFVDLFTVADDVDDDASWYGKNFDFTVDNTLNTSVNDGFTRHAFNADGGAAFDDARDGQGNVIDDTPLSLADLGSAFGDEEILYIALGTGTNYAGFDGFVDNFQFSYRSDQEQTVARQIDLEPESVPAPPALALIGVGLLGLRLARRAG